MSHQCHSVCLPVGLMNCDKAKSDAVENLIHLANCPLKDIPLSLWMQLSPLHFGKGATLETLNSLITDGGFKLGSWWRLF